MNHSYSHIHKNKKEEIKILLCNKKLQIYKLSKRNMDIVAKFVAKLGKKSDKSQFGSWKKMLLVTLKGEIDLIPQN